VILMSATGQRFTQRKAWELAEKSHLIFVCGHYEGVDQRVADHLVDEELSIGDYILTNGAIAATAVVDAVARLIPGVLGEADSATDESFSNGLLEYPHYTRPAEFRGWKVPEILLSGNHAAIEAWRKAEAAKRTDERRPDLRTPDFAPSSKLPTSPRRLDSERLRRASREREALLSNTHFLRLFPGVASISSARITHSTRLLLAQGKPFTFHPHLPACQQTGSRTSIPALTEPINETILSCYYSPSWTPRIHQVERQAV
jgi:hypothetical protein